MFIFVILTFSCHRLLVANRDGWPVYLFSSLPRCQTFDEIVVVTLRVFSDSSHSDHHVLSIMPSFAF